MPLPTGTASGGERVEACLLTVHASSFTHQPNQLARSPVCSVEESGHL